MFRFPPQYILIVLLLAVGCVKTRTQSIEVLPTDEIEVTGVDPASTNSATPRPPTSQPTQYRPSATSQAVTPTEPSVATLTQTPILWKHAAQGIEASLVSVNLPDQPTTFYAYVVRVDPAHVNFRVHYDPDQSHLIDEWQVTTGASIVVNAGFFAGNNTPVGRIVIEGQEYGYPLNYGEDTIGVAGVFGVVDDSIGLYAIGRSSFSPQGLRFDEAVESYPMLVLPGSQPVYPTETGEQARRTVLGIDRQGRVIIMVSDIPIFTLHQLADWLASSNLEIDSALNLDGGRSSGIAVSAPGEIKLINSYVPIPIVIAVYPK